LNQEQDYIGDLGHLPLPAEVVKAVIVAMEQIT
jgi:hypothetical protein